MKMAARAAIGPGPYVLSLAVGVAVYGAFAALAPPGRHATSGGVAFSILVGLVWVLGMALIQVALPRYHAAISQIVPLHMLNVIVTIALGFVPFAEARDLEAGRLGVGAILVAGS
jgi:uncharacterized membrane protein